MATLAALGVAKNVVFFDIFGHPSAAHGSQGVPKPPWPPLGVVQNLAFFSIFGHPSEPQGAQRGSLVALAAQKRTFSCVFRTRNHKLQQKRVFWAFRPPQTAPGRSGPKIATGAIKNALLGRFLEGGFFGKYAFVHKPRTHKNANPIHTYTQTHPSLCLRAHTHIHAYTQTHPSFCLNLGKSLQTRGK